MVCIIIIFGFGLEDGDKKIAHPGGLDKKGSSKEVFEALREGRDLNVFNNTVVPVNFARRIEQL